MESKRPLKPSRIPGRKGNKLLNVRQSRSSISDKAESVVSGWVNGIKNAWKKAKGEYEEYIESATQSATKRRAPAPDIPEERPAKRMVVSKRASLSSLIEKQPPRTSTSTDEKAQTTETSSGRDHDKPSEERPVAEPVSRKPKIPNRHRSNSKEVETQTEQPRRVKLASPVRPSVQNQREDYSSKRHPAAVQTQEAPQPQQAVEQPKTAPTPEMQQVNYSLGIPPSASWRNSLKVDDSTPLPHVRTRSHEDNGSTLRPRETTRDLIDSESGSKSIQRLEKELREAKARIEALERKKKAARAEVLVQPAITYPRIHKQQEQPRRSPSPKPWPPQQDAEADRIIFASNSTAHELPEVTVTGYEQTAEDSDNYEAFSPVQITAPMFLTQDLPSLFAPHQPEFAQD
ncbi:hypothetical protein SAICODRAFT_32113 [Saitoella complicata NRRL Y-17804]|uniref:Uncharacterized protein n=1 Tax=Saitoella complicata (strain BCRC 22490 / CBS 7301 / JCM 7358 / NBRC 10748 / NRRL Y-17804) TaxID=698492 RepID=A0A0E9NKL9_SAICN|nr:uncharacterized protein SAICODRAFT_32113 [Saitoella complicata NRRL Y-17804]ODQ50179.1 hypothetical protein SAICODRAFT_32113 [Saitoella complicata NRRL Y-17804]GAO49945.1 hypothetical protein G7K_4081-t1 [Saitoella complicata NRRL Y-17804]